MLKTLAVGLPLAALAFAAPAFADEFDGMRYYVIGNQNAGGEVTLIEKADAYAPDSDGIGTIYLWSLFAGPRAGQVGGSARRLTMKFNCAAHTAGGYNVMMFDGWGNQTSSTFLAPEDVVYKPVPASGDLALAFRIGCEHADISAFPVVGEARLRLLIEKNDAAYTSAHPAPGRNRSAGVGTRRPPLGSRETAPRTLR